MTRYSNYHSNNPANDQHLRRPKELAKQVLAARTDKELLDILTVRDKRYFNPQTWVSDVKFTLNWVRSKRLEYLEEEKLSSDSRNLQTESSESSKSPNSFSNLLESTKPPEPPSTPDWRAVCHNRVMDIEGTFSILSQTDCKRRGPMSLRYYTAQALSPYPENIKPQILQAGAWKDGWIHVWNACKKRGEDSYNVFKLFADEFAYEPDFTCHDELTYSGDFLTKFGLQVKNPGDLISYVSKSGLETYGGIRRYYLRDRLINNVNYHRFEYLPFDTNIYSLSKTLMSQRFNYITLLDLSGIRHSRETLLRLITVPRLIGLDVTGCQVDTNILFCWMLAIRNGLWSNLRLLCVGLNDIPGGSYILLSCPTLTYIEFDQNIDAIHTGRYSQWERRHKLYDSMVHAYGRGNINRADAPHFTRNHFPRHYGIGQKYFSLKTLFSDFSRYAPHGRAPIKMIVNPDFAVEYLNNGKCIIQEFEIGKMQSLAPTNDPIKNLWVDTNSRDNMFVQEFFRIRHSQDVLNLSTTPDP